MTNLKTVRPTGSVRYDNTHRVVIVTGGAQGIGLAICQAFHASGATVVCADVAEQHASQLPVGVHFRKTDTADRSQCAAVVDWTVSQFGALDILVNNAAIQPPASYVPVDELDPAIAERMISVNFSGYTHMAQFSLKQMKQQSSGVVVNLASGQGHRTARCVPIYGPIKAANILQAMQWAVEYARDGIRVVSVSPGAIDTPLVRAS